MADSSASGFGLDKVGCVGVDGETHVTSILSDDGLWIY